MDTLRSFFRPQAEPPAGEALFSAEAGGLHYSWRGRGPAQTATTIGIYNVHSEQWTLQPTMGPTPPGLCYGGCAFSSNHLYCFGGSDKPSQFNHLHKLNIENFQWSKVDPSNDPLEWPIRKFGCGLVAVNESALGCFGGYGIGPEQPGSTFTKNCKATDRSGWTNEFHLFDIQEDIWSSPEVKGDRPPPCAYFSFTKVDQDTVVLFGGSQPDYVRNNDLYLFNLTYMEVTKVEPTQGDPWPAEREGHSACCLNYGEECPKLLVFGGIGKDWRVLGDMWIFDVDTGKWTEVTPPESMKLRYFHSATATTLRPGLTEVLVFGGSSKWGGTAIAETTVLRFECSPSEAGAPTEKWTLVDVAYNNTRGSGHRLKEKRRKITGAKRRSSSVNDQSLRDIPHSSQDWVKGLEQQLLVAEQRVQEAEQRVQIAQRRCEEAEEREHTTQCRCEDAEHRAAKELQQKVDLQHQNMEAERRIQELVTDLQTMERRAQGAEQQLEDTLRQKEDIEYELEGKTKELSAHNDEMWRIPSSKVSTSRTIGFGGWGEVLEGSVKVAVKRLHIAILNPHNLERLQREMKLLAEVRHPNLVQFIGAVLDQSPPLIITELLDINLRQAYEQKRLGPGDRISILIDMAKALDYLHQRYEPIIHRDVSASNVLLQRMPNNQWKGKVSDLGSANFLQSAQTMGEGAIVYSPPEVIPQAYDDTEPPPQTVKIDVYSYGIVVCEVTASRFPSQEYYREMFGQVQREHPQVYELIMRCKSRQPRDRPSMAEILVELSSMKPF